jgi:hypothetical protein
MGFRNWSTRLVSRSRKVPSDDSELVEVARIPVFAGPLLCQRLSDAGIANWPEDSFSLVTKSLTETRVLVRRSDRAAADRIVAAHGSGR